MIEKNTKITNWLNVVISAVALILECVPRSLKSACMIGPNEYGPIHFSSYFGNPLSTHGPFEITLFIAIWSILILIFNIVVLFKDKKAIRIVLLTLNLLAFFESVLLFYALGNFVTAYNVIIAVLIFIQLALQIIYFWQNNTQFDKIKTALNCFSLAAISSALILESIYKSIKYTYSLVEGIENIAYDHYFAQPSGLISVLTAIVASSTVFTFLFVFILLFKDKKSIRITSLVWASLGAAANVALLIVLGKTISIYNVAINLLLIVPIIISVITLKSRETIKA